MNNGYLKIETFSEGYGIYQIRETMTVGELKRLLEDYDDDKPIYLSFNNGYTYGGITERMIEDCYDDEDEESEEF